MLKHYFKTKEKLKNSFIHMPCANDNNNTYQVVSASGTQAPVTFLSYS